MSRGGREKEGGKREREWAEKKGGKEEEKVGLISCQERGAPCLSPETTDQSFNKEGENIA